MSGGDFIHEEEKAATGREDRKINKNSWSSKNKVESEVYLWSKPTTEEAEKERSG